MRCASNGCARTSRGGESLLDYGCGSGILAIAGARLGAGRVVGTDVDRQAMRASEDNARANGVAATFVLPDALPAGDFDIVVANILANPLTLLAPALALRVRAGGRIALSGILEDAGRRGRRGLCALVYYRAVASRVTDGCCSAGERGVT